MAKSQKPRKRATTFKHKQKLKLSKSLTKGSFAVNILSLGEHAVLNVLNGQIVNTPEQARWLRKAYDSPCQWGFTYGCVCRAPDGWEYISHFFKRFRSLHRLEEMDIEIGECLEEAVDDVNKEHILSPFYIASPEGREFTAKEVYELIALKNTFSRLSTQYEYRQAYKLGMEELKAINILDYLPPQDKALPAILAKNNLTTFYDVREKDKLGLLAIKGISEKRMATIEKAFADCTLKNLDRLKNFVQYVKILEQFKNITKTLEKYTNEGFSFTHQSIEPA